MTGATKTNIYQITLYQHKSDSVQEQPTANNFLKGLKVSDTKAVGAVLTDPMPPTSSSAKKEEGLAAAPVLTARSSCKLAFRSCVQMSVASVGRRRRGGDISKTRRGISPGSSERCRAMGQVSAGPSSRMPGRVTRRLMGHL